MKYLRLISLVAVKGFANLDCRLRNLLQVVIVSHASCSTISQLFPNVPGCSATPADPVSSSLASDSLTAVRAFAPKMTTSRSALNMAPSSRGSMMQLVHERSLATACKVGTSERETAYHRQTNPFRQHFSQTIGMSSCKITDQLIQTNV